MATITYDHRPKVRPNNPSMGCLLIIAAIFTFYLGISLNNHAVAKHGTDAAAVRNCLDHNGHFMVLKNRTNPTFYLICKIDRNVFGVQVVTEDGEEKTSFIIGNWNKVVKYFGDWVTKFTKPLPWIQGALP